MSARTIVGPDDQNVTFVELFFDLVFVFSVTQVVGLLHHHLDWTGVGQSILVFWLVWWAWTQFTWALNAADTTHPAVELGTLAATGVAFFMAVSVPGAFGDRAIWFAIPYVLVRTIGLGLYAWVARAADPTQHAAVRRFGLVSVFGLVAVLAGGFAGGGALQYAFWGGAIVLDLIAALVGADVEGWNLHPEHFAERHGLFVIIALGETLIVAAGGLSGATLTGDLLLVGALSVAATCAMWWSYFACAKGELDRAIEEASGIRQSQLARDAFSLLHFPLALGIIAFAVGIEEIVMHPETPLALPGRAALGTGLFLFTFGMAAAWWRATRQWLVKRVVLSILTTVAVIVAGGIAPLYTLAIACAGLVLLGLLEYREDEVSEDLAF